LKKARHSSLLGASSLQAAMSETHSLTQAEKEIVKITRMEAMM
jgi:DNA-binding CsgD family transcriptional regulator